MRRRRLSEDVSGHLLLLSGMLLVMGFVSLAMVFSQTDRLGERGVLETRTSLLEPMSQWVERLNLTLRETAQLGVTNVSWFGDQVTLLAERLETEASTQGVYLKARVQTAPAVGMFWRESRCVAYSPDTKDGIVVGFEQVSRVETIAGAVLHVKATDGRERIESDVYVRIYECLAGTVNTWFLEATVAEGAAAGEAAARSTDDADAAMTIEEEIVTTPPDTGEPAVTNVSAHNWASAGNIALDDGAPAERPGSSTDDYMVFKWDMTGFSSGTYATTLQLRFDVWNNGEVVDDKLMLVANHPLGQLGPWEIPVTANVESTYLFSPSTSPSGDALWDLDELAATEWRLYTDEGVKFDPGSKTYVEYVDLVFTYYLAYHSLDVTFAFPEVPSVFTEHTIWFRYQITGGNQVGTETFDVQVWDGASWNTRMSLTRLDDTWQTVSYTLLPSETPDGMISLRLVDSGSGDGLATDQDVVQIDGLWLESSIPGAP